MGEGGALVINDEKYIERAEILREKGTNRSRFYRGEIDKYSWVDIGSSFLPSEFNVSYLYGQLEVADEINENRRATWNQYYKRLEPMEKIGLIELPTIPDECVHNAHIFYVKVKDLTERTRVLSYMKAEGIGAVFHYVPLHSADGGRKYGEFHGEDRYTTKESERLIRLPMFYGMTHEMIDRVIVAMQQALGYRSGRVSFYVPRGSHVFADRMG
jgi:dTDP-4-amino-4,6-dideoxygalactose transaminase